MILDSYRNLAKYASHGAGFADAAKFATENNIDTLPLGRIDVSENLFVLVQEYQTAPIDEGKFEAHVNYADIQYLHEGEEVIVWNTIDRLTQVSAMPENDIAFYNGTGTALPLTAGNFMIFFPDDAHMPSRCINEPRTNKKIVFKVRLV